MPKTQKGEDWAGLKRRVREKPGGRIYDRARGRTLVILARNHPDEYQDILDAEVKREKGRESRARRKTKTAA